MSVSDEIEIRILPDGSVSFSALSAELLRLAEAINPRDETLARRKAALTRAMEEPERQPVAKEVVRAAQPQ